MRSDAELTAGTWTLALTHNSITDTTAALSHSATADDVKAALLDLSNIGIVAVTKTSDTFYLAKWSVTFLSDMANMAQLVPVWTDMSAGYSLDTGNQILVETAVDGELCKMSFISTIVTILMHQFEDKCDNKMQQYVSIVSKSVYHGLNVLLLGVFQTLLSQVHHLKLRRHLTVE